MTALKTDDLPYEEKELFVPDLNELRTVLHRALLKNYEFVNVEVIDCPSLPEKKLGLTGCGLCGNPTLFEMGGQGYLYPKPIKSKIYDIKEIVRKYMDPTQEIFVLGAGCGPFKLRKTCCEGIYNMMIDKKGYVMNGGFTARLCGPCEDVVLECLPYEETTSTFLVNVYACRGELGKVLKVTCKKRTGERSDFVECLRRGLARKYKENCIGMGGFFMIKNGLVNIHVMRSFSKTPINTKSDEQKWLKFIDMPAPLTAVGYLLSKDPGLDTNLQHFHTFSNVGRGGHYQNDVCPDNIEYEGYFNVAERIVRLDRPEEPFKFAPEPPPQESTPEESTPKPEE